MHMVLVPWLIDIIKRLFKPNSIFSPVKKVHLGQSLINFKVMSLGEGLGPSQSTYFHFLWRLPMSQEAPTHTPSKKGCNISNRQAVGNITLKVLVATIDAQWEGMGDVGSARYEPALLPPCPTIRVLSYSN